MATNGMIERPPCLTRRPEFERANANGRPRAQPPTLIARQSRMAADALSNLLRTVRLTGATFFDIAAQDSWAIRSPARHLILPKILPGADHLIAYHVENDCMGMQDVSRPL